MITKWTMSNFKSVKNRTDLEFAPLTVFAGANSSGKSTVLQSVLLIAQTLGHKISSRSVVLNGALARLGQFDDLKSNGSHAKQITIGWVCRPSYRQDPITQDEFRFRGRYAFYGRRADSLREVSCEVSFAANSASSHRDTYQLQPQLFDCELSAKVIGDDHAETESHISIKRNGIELASKVSDLGIATLENAVARASLEYDIAMDRGALDEIQEDNPSGEPVGCVLNHFLPERLSVRIDATQEEARQITALLFDVSSRVLHRSPVLDMDMVLPSKILDLLRETIEDSRNAKSPPISSGLHVIRKSITDGITLREWRERVLKTPAYSRYFLRNKLRDDPELFDRCVTAVRGDKQTRYEIIPCRPPSRTMEAVTYCDFYFTNSVRYLGPLRDEPKALYPLTSSVGPLDVGLKGELTASVLDLHKHRFIEYIPTVQFDSSEVVPTSTHCRLEDAVCDWLKYLGVADSVHSYDKGKLGHELKVSLTRLGRSHDLTHVGVGVSQVLPILVMCLLAESDSTLIFEQPELHLHPKVQTLLGDFFLSMALLGKQCILETHSEYLINRLRFRAAAAPASNSLVRFMKMYFVEKLEDSSNFREVRVNEYGAIPDWPEGFFDQSQTEAEAIMLAATRKRKTRGGK